MPGSGVAFLMQFQADVIDASVVVPLFEELSGSGPAYAAGMALGLYSKDVFARESKAEYVPVMAASERERRIRGWHGAIRSVLTK